MKKFFLTFVLAFTITIPDAEIKVVENDVPDAKQWLLDAWAAKVAKCRSRIVGAEVELSLKNNETVPAGETAIVNKHLARPGYKNRKERDLENTRGR